MGKKHLFGEHINPPTEEKVSPERKEQILSRIVPVTASVFFNFYILFIDHVNQLFLSLDSKKATSGNIRPKLLNSTSIFNANPYSQGSILEPLLFNISLNKYTFISPTD